MSLVEIEGMRFGYGSERLFNDFSLVLKEPRMLGILGVNGSGKSTLMRLLMGDLRPQQGTIRLLGEKPGSAALRKQVGLAAQEVGFPETIRVEELLRFVEAHYEEPLPIEELFEGCQLDGFRQKRCGELSGGMRRRVALAVALVGRPKLLLLDEPATGLDKEGRAALMQVVTDYQRKENALVLMISHHPEEVSRLVDHFLLIKREAPPKLIEPQDFEQLSRLRTVQFETSETLTFSCAREVVQEANRYTVVVEDSDALVRTLTQQTSDFAKLSIDQMAVEEILERYL